MQGMSLHMSGVKQTGHGGHEYVGFGGIVTSKVAHINVKCHGVLFRPGVNAQVRFSQQHGGRDAARALRGGREGMKHMGDRLQTRARNRLPAMFTQKSAVRQPLGLTMTVVKIGGKVQSLHGSNYSYQFIFRNTTMSRQSIWATKVAALVQGGNSEAAIAQIKVAPTVKDLKDLRALLISSKLLARHPNVDDATSDMIVALSSPRLHRSP